MKFINGTNFEVVELLAFLKRFDEDSLYTPDEFDTRILFQKVDNVRRQLSDSFDADVFVKNPSIFQDGALYTYLSFSSQPFNNDFSGLYFSCFGQLSSLVHNHNDAWLSKKDAIVNVCLDAGFSYIDVELLDEVKYDGRHDSLTGGSWWERYFADAF